MCNTDIKGSYVWSNIRNRCDVDISKCLHVELTIPKLIGTVKKVFICINRYGEEPSIIKELLIDKAGSEYTEYFVDVKFDMYGSYYYFFKLEFVDNYGNYLKKAIKISRETRKPIIVDEFEESPYWVVFVRYDNSDVPEWATDAIYYQIMVDRFNRSDNAAPMKLAYRNYRNWGEMPNWERNEYGEFHNNDFFGGDLKGVEDKLDYLKELGITVIYLSPIFESLFRYDGYAATNHMKIDPDKGSVSDLKSLCLEAEKREMHVILDIAINHSSSDIPIFKDAISNPKSPYRDWFHFDDENNYRCWYGEFKDMPVFNQLNPGYQEYIYGEGGFIDFFSKIVHGFRFDVSEEIMPFVLRGCRERANKNGAHIMIGECWHKARNDVLGNALDAPTNYVFTDAVLRYVVDRNITFFLMQVMDILDSYPQNTLNTMLNSLDTQDTVRILTMFGGKYMRHGDERLWDIDKDPSPWHYDTNYGRRFDTDGFRQFEWENDRLGDEEYEYAKKLLKATSMILYFMSGCPCMYYGTEVGMHGYKDPFNRKTFPWDDPDTELFEFFKKLFKFRKECILRDCFFEVREISKDIIMYTMTNRYNSVLVAVNPTDSNVAMSLPMEFENCWNTFKYNADEWCIGPYGGIIVKKDIDPYEVEEEQVPFEEAMARYYSAKRDGVIY